MKQVLSVGQIKHLQKIGIELRNTSMLLWHPQILDGIPNSVWDLSFWSESLFSEDNVYPAYTLQDILDKLPCFIGKEVLTIQKLADNYNCHYIIPCYCNHNCSSFVLKCSISSFTEALCIFLPSLHTSSPHLNHKSPSVNHWYLSVSSLNAAIARKSSSLAPQSTRTSISLRAFISSSRHE